MTEQLPPRDLDGRLASAEDESIERWRAAFPYTSAGEELVARRDFARYLLAASGVFAAGTVGAAVWASLQRANRGEPRPIIRLADVPEGTDHLFDYPDPGEPAILIHLPGGELRAFSQKCTHLGCVVIYQPDKERIYCPCHEGVFELASGEPVAGPPQRALARIDIEVRDGVVWAEGIRR